MVFDEALSGVVQVTLDSAFRQVQLCRDLTDSKFLQVIQLKTSRPQHVLLAESLQRLREFLPDEPLQEIEFLVRCRSVATRPGMLRRSLVRVSYGVKWQLAASLLAARVINSRVGHHPVQPGGEVYLTRILSQAQHELAPDALSHVLGILMASHHVQRDFHNILIAVLIEHREGRRITLRSVRGDLIKIMIVGGRFSLRLLGSHGPTFNFAWESTMGRGSPRHVKALDSNNDFETRKK